MTSISLRHMNSWNLNSLLIAFNSACNFAPVKSTKLAEQYRDSDITGDVGRLRC